jgi:hypothetical protein
MGNALPRLYGEIVLQKNIEIEKYSAFWVIHFQNELWYNTFNIVVIFISFLK